jgi:hypothetical protein
MINNQPVPFLSAEFSQRNSLSETAFGGSTEHAIIKLWDETKRMKLLRETLHKTRSPPDALPPAPLAIFMSTVLRRSQTCVILSLLNVFAHSGQLHYEETSRFETNLHSERL